MIRLATILIAAAGIAAAAPFPHRIERIPAPDGRYDYAAFDPALQRLFVGRGEGVMTVDFPSRKISPRFVAGRGVAAVLMLPRGEMLSTNGDSNSAVIFERRSGRKVAEIPTGADPDGAAFDEGSGLAFVMNGDSKDITIIDPRKRAAVGAIALPGTPEGAISDGAGHLFVNIEDSAEIARIDIATRRISATFPQPGCKEPTAIVYDPVARLLVTACHNGVAKLIDARTGRDRGGFRIGKMADGIAFDSRRRRLYISCNDGTLTVAGLDRQGRATRMGTIATDAGARTIAMDRDGRRLFLPASAYAPDAAGEPQRVPGTFKILVVHLPR